MVEDSAVTAGSEAVPQRRSDRKRAAILEAATARFLHHGYLGTSMDEIAADAAVSKQTVYKHFCDKKTLFREIVASTVDEISDPNYEAVRALEESGDVDADLREFARGQLARVMQPRLLQLRRLVIGETERFPELGQLFYERGPGRTISALATVLERLARRGALVIDDPLQAAAHFNWLVMSIPLNRAMLLGGDLPPAADELSRYADSGVSVFLAAYGSSSKPARDG
jgi:TetR/AcrR family transcriptional regulator, mexJK operon transcriptional repressor